MQVIGQMHAVNQLPAAVSLTFPSNLPFCQQRQLGQRRAMTYHCGWQARHAIAMTRPAVWLAIDSVVCIALLSVSLSNYLLIIGIKLNNLKRSSAATVSVIHNVSRGLEKLR